jgi:hypothetical protein
MSESGPALLNNPLSRNCPSGREREMNIGVC